VRLPLVILIFFTFLHSTVNAQVIVEFRNNTYRYNDKPFLSDVVARLVYDNRIYWHNAVLYDLDDQQVQVKKRTVIKNIESILKRTGKKTAKWAALKKVENDIQSWNLAYKLPHDLDFDLLRVRPELDRRMDDGQYFLSLPFRSFTIQVFGAVEKNLVLAHQSKVSVENYLKDGGIALLEYADTEYVYVIHRNGDYTKVSLGLHSSNHVEVPPDGSIYVPLREIPFDSTNEDLNLQVVQLAGNRLPK